MSTLASALQSRPSPPAAGEQTGRPCKITVHGLNFHYGAKRALENISIDIPANLVTAFIGPSGCGKSTFLRTLNRMNDIIPGTRVEGTIEIDGRYFDSVRPHWFPWTMPFNMTGHPAVSLPCGFGSDGLPIGLQLVGRFRADAELLRVSALFEASTDLLSRWPG